MNILVTGGAGFIGSHIIEALIQNPDVKRINILDNLSTGHERNIAPFLSDLRVRFFKADIRDLDACKEAVEGMNYVCHQDLSTFWKHAGSTM
jgi:UDP-N-acetylglucosamine 4-epimerase